VLPLPGEALLAFGLRGNLYRSEDAGSSWQKIETGTVAMLDGAARFAVLASPSWALRAWCSSVATAGARSRCCSRAIAPDSPRADGR